MSPIRRPAILLTTALLLTLGVPVPASAHSGPAGDVRVVRLSVDGRYDSPPGLDNTRPTLAWQMTQTGDCRQLVCAADRQTGYEVQAAPTVADLSAGRLLWRTGKVFGDTQQVRFGRDLGSRDTVAWRVRVWIAAGFAPPPNLATKLVARTAEPVKAQEEFKPVSVTNPAPGTWVFDFGQNIVGWPRLRLDRLPAGTTVKVAPAESLNADGTVDQASLMGGGGSRGVDLFNTYTTAGGRSETWHPNFNYFGMQWVQVTGLPDGFTPTKDLITGVRLPADTPIAGNVALKTPVYDWGYSGRFGDEINWGNAIVLVPSILHQLYGDTATMAASYDRLVRFVDYLQRQKVVDGFFVDAALADWVSAEPISGRITGTWGYYLTIQSMARIATLTGHPADANRYTALAEEIKAAFNRAFFNEAQGRYAGPEGPTQAAQALALDAGLVPEGSQGKVLDALVELIYALHPNGTGPHFSGGTIGMGPIVRALMNGDRDDVLWAALQQNDQPSYGYFLESTPANPGGMTTIGEASGSYETPAGWARSAWTKTNSRFSLSVTVPANTQAEVWVPATDKRAVAISNRAAFQRIDGAYAVFAVSSGSHSFTVRTGS